jgi:hypothetical protein
MVHRARAFAFAAASCLAACSGSTGGSPTPDTSAPAIANPVNRGVYFGDPLRVVFTEPIALTAGTAVTVESAFVQGQVPATVTLLSAGVIEVVLGVPPHVTDAITVTVHNVADPAGNAMLRGAARFELTAWQEVGGGPATPAPIAGYPMPRLALDGEGPVVSFAGGMARLSGGTWEVSPLSYAEQRVASVPGSLPLRAGVLSDAIVLERLDGSSAERLLRLPSPSPYADWGVIAAGRAGILATEAVVSWQRSEGAVREVHVARTNPPGSGVVRLPLGEGGTSVRNAAIAMSSQGVAYVAVDDSVDDTPPFVRPQRVRVYAAGPDSLDFRSIGPDVDLAFATDLAVDWTGALYLATLEGGLRVRAWDGTTWSDLGSANASAVGGSLAIDPQGAPLAATLSRSGVGNATSIQVRRWNGAAWEDVADPIQATSQWVGDPRLAVDVAGRIFVAYEEWTGEGLAPSGGGPTRVRVRVFQP